MKITYKFADNTVSEVEVSEEVGTLIMDSRRKEENAARKERYHCWSLDAIDYEGAEYGIPDFTDALFDGSEERDALVRAAFSHLSDVQRRRLVMLACGLSLREIARREGKDIKTVRESVDGARKKFLKNFVK